MSIVVEPVRSRSELREFIEFPRRLYHGIPQWVPTLDLDYRSLHYRRHPFFRHAEAEFLLARRESGSGREVVARVMMIHNDRYNKHHGTQSAHFYYADFPDQDTVVDSLFAAMCRWARDRGLRDLTGPLFTGATVGGGALIQGFEHPAAMTMMPYNFAYYPRQYERVGCEKRFDLYSLFIDPDTFILPEQVERIAERVRSRGRMKVLQFSRTSELKALAYRVADLYNPTLANHEENYPLTEAELRQLIRELLLIARPDLVKIITYDDEVVGYLLAFPDLTPALQRNGGRVSLPGILRLLREKRKPAHIILNGMGILERCRRIGGNALIYSELTRTVRTSPEYDFRMAEMVQINEHTDLMLADLRRLGARVAKIHRVYGLKSS